MLLPKFENNKGVCCEPYVSLFDLTQIAQTHITCPVTPLLHHYYALLFQELKSVLKAEYVSEPIDAVAYIARDEPFLQLQELHLKILKHLLPENYFACA